MLAPGRHKRVKAEVVAAEPAVPPEPAPPAEAVDTNTGEVAAAPAQDRKAIITALQDFQDSWAESEQNWQ
jgi:hypothetical protein